MATCNRASCAPAFTNNEHIVAMHRYLSVEPAFLSDHRACRFCATDLTGASAAEHYAAYSKSGTLHHHHHRALADGYESIHTDLDPGTIVREMSRSNVPDADAGRLAARRRRKAVLHDGRRSADD